ncbi:sugar ABC transporter permease, partial [bacterium]|nr:sugar ABC transporter permease [bacterium]
MLPATIVLLVFFFIPFFQTIYFSFLDYGKDIYSPVHIGLNNYIELFHSSVFYKVMFNTFLYLFIAVPILAVVPLFIAILINQKLRFLTLY